MIMACRTEEAKQMTDVSKEKTYSRLTGPTMGTFYNITFFNEKKLELRAQVDSLLIEINQGASTYIPSSVISQFNQTSTNFSLEASAAVQHFKNNFISAKRIFNETKGAFDPTVMPLVQYWGFGTEKRPVTKVDSTKVGDLKKLIGFEKITYSTEAKNNLSKSNSEVQLDFSAIAKGYAVDEICRLLDQNNIQHYFVEIGGEVRVKGKSKRGDFWRVGINVPKSDAAYSDFKEVVALNNQAVASSGNYRNFYEVNGQKYGHTINPQTGFPEQTSLLSVSILADDCITADAYATACMVMGLEKSYAFIDSMDSVEALLIYGNEEGGLSVKMTAGFKTN